MIHKLSNSKKVIELLRKINPKQNVILSYYKKTFYLEDSGSVFRQWHKQIYFGKVKDFKKELLAQKVSSNK